MFGVLLLHSFGSTNLEFKEFEKHLQEQGFKTTVPLLPGHGTYPEDLENYTFEDWVQAGEKALLDLNCQGNFIIGEITGALIALILASLHPELLGIVTLSGLISRPKWSTILNSLVKARSNVFPLASNRNPIIDLDQTLWKKAKIYEMVPRKSLREVYALIKKGRKHLDKIYQPIFVLQSTAATDVTVKNAHTIFK